MVYCFFSKNFNHNNLTRLYGLIYILNESVCFQAGKMAEKMYYQFTGGDFSMTDENYGQQIKKLRIDLGMTQNEVAEALSVTPGYICNVENGRTAMSLRILIYFAKLTGVTLDSLVGRIDSEYQNTALDNEIYERIHKLDENTKMKILKTLKLWEKPLLNQ